MYYKFLHNSENKIIYFPLKIVLKLLSNGVEHKWELLKIRK